MRRLAGFARTAPLVSVGSRQAITLSGGTALCLAGIVGAGLAGAALAVVGLAMFQSYRTVQRKQRRNEE